MSSPILLGTGSQAAECQKRINKLLADGNAVHVIEFCRPGKGIYGEVLPTGVTYEPVSTISDPTPEERWGKEHIYKIHQLATSVYSRIIANNVSNKKEVIMIVCRAGMNRSRTVAGIAARLVPDYKNKHEMPKLPVDEALKEFVFIYDITNIKERTKELEKLADKGISGQGLSLRSKRPRND